MTNSNLPRFDTARNSIPGYENGILVVRTYNQYMHAMNLRSLVYMGEQFCPYYEEFDGNDFCGNHLVAYKNGEPIATLRIRYIAQFAKVERLSVHPLHRNSKIALKLVLAAKDFCLMKGFSLIYGHAQEGKENFWKFFGGKAIDGHEKFKFSNYLYTEMLCEFAPIDQPLSIKSGPYVLIRPEGRWDIPGPLEKKPS